MSDRLIRICCVVAALALLTPLMGCAAAKLLDQDHATVVGTVTEWQTDVPVEGVLVTIGSQHGTTEANGQYQIDSVPLGTQTITFEKAGWTTWTSTVDVTYPGVAKNAMLVQAP